MTTTYSHGPVRRRRTQYTAWLSAGMIAVMLLGQLYDYENFASVLMVLMPFSDQPLITVLAAKLAILELLALPYLLAIPMSRLMRLASAAFGVSVALFWLFTSLTNGHVINSGLFSTSLELPGGIVAVCWSLLLLGCLLYIVVADIRSRPPTT